MMNDALELDHLVSRASLRIEKMDWIVDHLLNSVTGDGAIIVGLLSDMVDLAGQDLASIQALSDQMHHQALSAAQKVA